MSKSFDIVDDAIGDVDMSACVVGSVVDDVVSSSICCVDVVVMFIFHYAAYMCT